MWIEHSFQVTDKVGPTKNDSPELIQPLDDHKSSISHFLKPAHIKDEMNKDLTSHAQKVCVSGSLLCLSLTWGISLLLYHPFKISIRKERKV